MSSWLLSFFGIAPRVAPNRRRSLVARLKEPIVADATIELPQEALQRHEVLEQSIATHKAEVDVEQTQCREVRQEHLSEIAESTISLEKAQRDETRRRKRRTRLFDVSEMARDEARRRREA